MAEFSYNNDLVISLDEMMDFIDSVGAASINETKTHFGTGSKSVRHALGRLLMEDQIILTAYGGGIYILRRSGQKGKPNVMKLRRAAGAEPSKGGRPKKVTTHPDSYDHPGFHPVKDESDGGLFEA